MTKLNHTKSLFVEAADQKAIWLRQREGVDLDVVETVETLVEAIVRLDAHIRAVEGQVDKKLGKLHKKLDRQRETV